MSNHGAIFIGLSIVAAGALVSGNAPAIIMIGAALGFVAATMPKP